MRCIISMVFIQFIGSGGGRGRGVLVRRAWWVGGRALSQFLCSRVVGIRFMFFLCLTTVKYIYELISNI